MLVRSEHWSPDTKKLCSVILDTSIKEADKYQVGMTKLFFRAGMVSLNKD
jgi:myosin V